MQEQKDENIKIENLKKRKLKKSFIRKSINLQGCKILFKFEKWIKKYGELEEIIRLNIKL